MKKLSLAIIGFALLSMAGVIGCNSASPTDPLANFQPEIVNNADNFSFQATAIENVTAVISYNWSNSGTQATINHSSVVDSGTAVVAIYDNNDSLVYTNGLVASLNEPSSVGVAGTWRIVVTLVNVYGTLNFTSQML